jgi:hypothetical protein
VLLHVALHAAHHVEGKPLEDLARAVTVATDDQWRAAADLAARLDGLDAFASGMRLLPQAAAIAAELNLGRNGSVEFSLREAQVPLAEGLNQLMSASPSDKARIVVRELFPNPAFMRWALPLARHGCVGLFASYPLRWLILLRGTPRAAATVWRVRRRRTFEAPTTNSAADRALD